MQTNWMQVDPRTETEKINPLVMSGLSHPYHLDDSSFICRGIGNEFFIFISFFDENHVSKQNSLRWDAGFCGVTSGAILFAYVTLKGRQAYMG